MADHSKLSFTNGVLYRHKVLRINYTSDSLNPHTHPNIIILSHEDDDTHPYWYAKIIGIFHAVVQHPSKPDPTSMDLLWVRWYGRNILHHSGWKSKHLPRIGFVDSDNELPFGFLDLYMLSARGFQIFNGTPGVEFLFRKVLLNQPPT